MLRASQASPKVSSLSVLHQRDLWFLNSVQACGQFFGNDSLNNTGINADIPVMMLLEGCLKSNRTSQCLPLKEAQGKWFPYKFHCSATGMSPVWFSSLKIKPFELNYFHEVSVVMTACRYL